LAIVLGGIRRGDNSFDSTLKGAALNTHPVMTFEALNADISTEPDYSPFIATAGVLLFEMDYFTQLYL